jgi:hypothetical protein
MASSHSFTLGDQLVERLLRDSRPSSRCNSPALSRCSSNRGSVYSEESTEPSIRESEENLNDNEHEEDGEEDRNQLTVSNVCSTCKEENQIRQALSVQQARQRYCTGITKSFIQRHLLLCNTTQFYNSPHDLLFIHIGATCMEA